MIQELGIYRLFSKNEKCAKNFYEWCKESEELCDYDLEQLENDLFLPCIGTTSKYVHLNNGNILDWLEHNGYYIGLPLRGKFKFVPVVHYMDSETVHKTPVYSNSGMKSRVKAIEKGIEKALEALEEKL